MNETVVQLLHDLQGQLSVINTHVHMHMSGERRFETERILDEVQTTLKQVWAHCLSCQFKHDDLAEKH